MSIIPMIDLLADKRNPIKEVHLIWFEHCNLSCSFCHQDHDSIVGMDSILEKTIDTITKLDPLVQYKVNVTGGELFHDDIADELFPVYLESIVKILEGLPRAEVLIGTNLVFNPVRLIDMMNQLDSRGFKDRYSVATSYDPAGRFNTVQLEQFLKNIALPGISERISTVNVVITKQNIDSVLSGRCKTDLDWMYSHYPLYFDHFMANDSYAAFQPSEERILEFFLYIKEHYPKSGPIQEMTRGNYGELTCQSTIIFTDDNQMVTCWGEAGKDRTMDYQEGLVRKNAAEQDFLEFYDCLSCEYYRRCTMRCFLHHRSLDERPKECQIKLLYDSL